MSTRALCARASALAFFAMLSACASGGGGGGGGTPTPPTQPPTQPPPPPPPPAFAIGAAARATKGSNTTADLLAVGNASVNAIPNGTALPLRQSVIRLNSSGATQDSAANLSGATLTLLNATSGQLRMSIPGLNVNVDFIPPPSSSTGIAVPGNRQLYLGVVNFGYVGMGAWAVEGSAEGSFAHFIMGYQTPPASKPTTGTATYVGGTVGSVFKQNHTAGVLVGDLTLIANFGTASLSGNLTNMVAQDPDTSISSAWNDVALQAGISTSGTFSGTTATTSAPGTPLALQAGATGFVDGAFYGPTANEVGAIWTLHDGTNTAFGSLAGAQNSGSSAGGSVTTTIVCLRGCQP